MKRGMAGLHRTTLIFSTVSFLIGAAAAVETELRRDFVATVSRSNSDFQSILIDPTGNFSLGFLRINGTGLSVAVVHVESSVPLWSAEVTNPVRPRWSDRTVLTFDGSLVISDPTTGLLWSTRTNGDHVVLRNTSELQVLRDDPPAILWNSFGFPGNTLLENQNFTSNMSLVSSNGLYTMRLGDNFIGLYAKFGRGNEQIYWRHRALEARAQIIDGAGPIYAQVNSDGFLAMYQNSSIPVDIESFRSFQRAVDSFVIVRLEQDGNLKGHYWNGTNWVMDYVAIPEFCDLPSPCGSYGLCSQDNDTCNCLMNNVTDPQSGRCGHGAVGDLCGKYATGFRVLRRSGVELPNKELVAFQTVPSLEQCEAICEHNCSCWGAVYNNGSGSCYVIDYPIQTLMSVEDNTKLGYFKVVDETHHGKAYRIGFGVGIAVWVMIGLVVIGAMIGSWYYWRCMSRKGVKSYLDDENKVTPGPYKDLGSASFRSIEMS